MSIEVQAAQALYEKRWAALKSRFADVYSILLNANKGNVEKSEQDVIDYASRLTQDAKEAKAHLIKVDSSPT